MLPCFPHSLFHDSCGHSLASHHTQSKLFTMVFEIQPLQSLPAFICLEAMVFQSFDQHTSSLFDLFVLTTCPISWKAFLTAFYGSFCHSLQVSGKRLCPLYLLRTHLYAVLLFYSTFLLIFILIYSSSFNLYGSYPY